MVTQSFSDGDPGRPAVLRSVFPHTMETAQTRLHGERSFPCWHCECPARDGAFVNRPMAAARDLGLCPSRCRPGRSVLTERSCFDPCGGASHHSASREIRFFFRASEKRMQDAHVYPDHAFSALADFEALVSTTRGHARANFLRYHTDKPRGFERSNAQTATC